MNFIELRVCLSCALINCRLQFFLSARNVVFLLPYMMLCSRLTQRISETRRWAANTFQITVIPMSLEFVNFSAAQAVFIKDFSHYGECHQHRVKIWICYWCFTCYYAVKSCTQSTIFVATSKSLFDNEKFKLRLIIIILFHHVKLCRIFPPHLFYASVFLSP